MADLSGCGQGAGGYAEAVADTDGEILDICRSGWGDDLEDLADAIDDLPPAFVLAREAAPGSIVATVGGADVETSYDAEARAVIVPAAAPPGTAVSITYAAPGVCDP